MRRLAALCGALMVALTPFGAAAEVYWIGDDDDEMKFGSAQGDVLDGRGGDDYLMGWHGDDVIGGGSGSDTLFSDEGSDSAFGGPGQDALWASAGNDYLNGGSGNDYLELGWDRDTLAAGIGDDRVKVLEAPDGLAESVDCGPGHDVVTFVGVDVDPKDSFPGCELLSTGE